MANNDGSVGAFFAFWENLPLFLPGALEGRPTVEMESGSQPIGVLAAQPVSAQCFFPSAARMVRWETTGLLVGHGDLMLELQHDAHNFHAWALPGENSTCDKSTIPDTAKNWGTMMVKLCLLEGPCGRDQEDGDLWWSNIRYQMRQKKDENPRPTLIMLTASCSPPTVTVMCVVTTYS